MFGKTMGYNTSVLILNDCLDGLDKDPELGKKITTAIARVGDTRRGERDGQVTVPLHAVNKGGGGCFYANPLVVVETHHADMNSIVVFGGNCATVLGFTRGNHHSEENKLHQLRQLAGQMGYDLHKKRKRKPQR